jgi:ribonucleoside-triphosphate reductase
MGTYSRAIKNKESEMLGNRTSSDMDLFQQFIVKSKYCRWDDTLGRRESWVECVDRYYNYICDRFDLWGNVEMELARVATIGQEVFPSMRALMTAGKAASVDDVCLYNCSYIAVDEIRSFSDIMYILCCGTGVGFSCESKAVNNLPDIPEEITRDTARTIQVPDSRRGWADSFLLLLIDLYNGIHPTWDLSRIRPAGSRLKTFGGRASGPEPLDKLFRYVIKMFDSAKGRKLTSLEVHDIVCLTGEIVIAGAVRRSALISLSDLHDRDMATAKSGPWWENNSHRSLSNNSAVYTSKPSLGDFISEWQTMYNSRSGERGICNRESLSMLAERAGRKVEGIDFGTNPCSEIILRSKQFCNLSEVVIRDDDTLETLLPKVELATIVGTIQSACTNFKYLDPDWKENCNEERLLGVSFTGIYDNKLMSGQMGMPKLRHTLNKLKERAQAVNLKWADILGIEPSKSITCCKPSGTTSCVAGTSSGLHPRYSEYYIRRVRIDIKDPICKLMIDQGITHEKCRTRPEATIIFSFPMRSPDNAIVQKDLNPIDHLDLWLEYQNCWCDHKPSITVSYTDDTFMGIGQWVWENWEYISGISFLPLSDHVYDQAPFEPISKAVYEQMAAKIPASIDWSLLSLYEKEDHTTNSHNLACHGGACEVVDLVEN